MRKNKMKISPIYCDKLISFITDLVLGATWMIYMFTQIILSDIDRTAMLLASLSGILSSAWFVIAYYEWNILKTIPKTIEEDKDES